MSFEDMIIWDAMALPQIVTIACQLIADLAFTFHLFSSPICQDDDPSSLHAACQHAYESTSRSSCSISQLLASQSPPNFKQDQATRKAHLSCCQREWQASHSG